MQRVELGDVYARVSTAGHTGTRAFVLVPGIGVSSNYFDRLAYELNEFGPVIALDLPGFGGVPHPKGRRMKIRDFADLVGHVIDVLQLDDPVLIGHSMGTQVVADLASRHRRPSGEPLSDIVLIGPVINRHERQVGIAGRRFLQTAVREPPKIAMLAIYAYLLCGPRWFWRVLPTMMTYPLEDVLPHIESQTLVLTGQLDTLCPRSWTQEVLDLLPRAQGWEIAGAAHSVMHANAVDVARLCVRHARRQEPDGPVFQLIRNPSEQHPRSPDLATTAKAATSFVQEVVGIVTDNDDVIARAKTRRVEAEALINHHTELSTEPVDREEAPGAPGNADAAISTATAEARRARPE